MSNQEDSLANIVTVLEAATLGGVSMSASTVHRSRPPLDPPFFDRLDESLGNVIVFMEQGVTSYEYEAHNTLSAGAPLVVGTMEVFIVVALKWATDGDPNNRTINPDTQMNDVIDDVISSLLPTHERGGAARDTTLSDEGPLDGSGIAAFDDWVCHEMRFSVEFEFAEDTP